ncbi:MAG TPA: hypothetical protein VH722_01965 [Alphaproteobacteria bacterium]|nr:hypothetical protein [Alphaproteobacteria bacterium]
MAKAGSVIGTASAAGGARFSFLGMPIAVGCLAAAAAAVLHYPIVPWLFALVLAFYAVALWRFPWLWLIVVPVTLAGLDLTPWTGWSYVTESDLFILVTVGVLAVFAPVKPTEWLPHGPARALIAVAVASYAISTAIAFRAHIGPSHSDLVYMQPANALRISKGFAAALVLLPFLRARQREHEDAWTYLAAGMVGALALVALETFVERAVFPGILDIVSAYPAAGPFSSMHIGGGHLGVFVALAMPFAFLRRDQRHKIERNVLAALTVAATYAVFITFSPIIYGATAISAALTFSGRTLPKGEAGGRRRQGDRTIRLDRNTLRPIIRAIYVGIMVIAVMFGLMGTSLVMSSIHRVGATVYHRLQSLDRRLALRDNTVKADLFGMGMGSFPRTVFSRAPDGQSNFGVYHDGGDAYLSLESGPQFFFGQKVPVRPGLTYTVNLVARAERLPTGVKVMLCEKYLLASQHCAIQVFQLARTDDWESLSAELNTDTMTRNAVFGPYHRPVDLALVSTEKNTPVEISAVRLVAPDGTQLLINGNFDRGTERWYFTDEIHDYWQIMNQYVMTFFERGIFGEFSFIAMMGGAVVGAWRAMRQGDRMGTAVMASLATFVLLCLSESLLHAPRLTTIFYLVCFVGLLMLEHGTNREYLELMRQSRIARGLPPPPAEKRRRKPRSAEDRFRSGS